MLAQNHLQKPEIFSSLKAAWGVLSKEIARQKTADANALLSCPKDTKCPGFVVNPTNLFADTLIAQRCPCKAWIPKVDNKVLQTIRDCRELLTKLFASATDKTHPDTFDSWLLADENSLAFVQLLLSVLPYKILKASEPLHSMIGQMPAQQKAHKRVQQALALQELFFNTIYQAVTWSSIREADQKIMAENILTNCDQAVILFLNASKISNSGSFRKDIDLLEDFVSEVFKRNSPLIIVSQIPLTAPSASPLNFDYTSDSRTSFRDKNNRLRFSSTRLTHLPQKPLQDLMRQGAFDRLIELLYKGQNWLESIPRNSQ